MYMVQGFDQHSNWDHSIPVEGNQNIQNRLLIEFPWNCIDLGSEYS